LITLIVNYEQVLQVQPRFLSYNDQMKRVKA